MHRSLPQLGLCLAAVVVFHLALSADASACSLPCVEQRRAAAEGTVIPVNVPAIPLPLGISDATVVELKRNGALVSTKVERGGLVPDAPLEQGEYALEYLAPCSFSKPTPIAHRLVFGPPVPIPSQDGSPFGKVTMRPEERQRVFVSNGSPSCTTGVDAAVVALDIEVSDELRPLLPILQFERRTAAGVVEVRSPVGQLEAIPREVEGPDTDQYVGTLPRVDRITHKCDAAGGTSTKTTWEIAATIGGRTVGAPVRVEVEAIGAACAPGGSGAPGATASGNDGCTIGRVAGARSGAGFAALGIVGLALVKRRRRA